jgi:hypothetical protein
MSVSPSLKCQLLLTVIPIKKSRISQGRKGSFFSLGLQPSWALASDFPFHDYFTEDRTPWTRDQLVARPLPNHRTTQTQNKHIHIPNIHTLCGIRTRLSPLGYRDRRKGISDSNNKKTHNIKIKTKEKIGTHRPLKFRSV